jgi:hypothetical protein
MLHPRYFMAVASTFFRTVTAFTIVYNTDTDFTCEIGLWADLVGCGSAW